MMDELGNFQNWIRRRESNLGVVTADQKQFAWEVWSARSTWETWSACQAHNELLSLSDKLDILIAALAQDDEPSAEDDGIPKPL